MGARALIVLRSVVPAGGYGRSLTATELRGLRAAGVTAPRGSIVLRAHGLEHRGHLYRPITSGGYSSVDGLVLTLITVGAL